MPEQSLTLLQEEEMFLWQSLDQSTSNTNFKKKIEPGTT